MAAESTMPSTIIEATSEVRPEAATETPPLKPIASIR